MPRTDERRNVIRGGLFMAGLVGGPNGSADARSLDYALATRIIDWPAWFAASFSKNHTIFVKMDAEGAELSIIPAMRSAGTLGWMDTVFWECHGSPQQCGELEGWMTAVGVEVLREGKDYEGWDSFLAPLGP